MNNFVTRSVALILIFSALFVLSLPIRRQSSEQSSNRAPVADESSPDNQKDKTNKEPTGKIYISDPVKPGLSIPARKAPAYVVEHRLDREVNPRMNFNQVDSAEDNQRTVANDVSQANAEETNVAVTQAVSETAVAEHTFRETKTFTAPNVNIDGQSYTFVNPPDTIGDVGPNHFVQALNGGGGTVVQIYDKAGAIVKVQFALDSIGTGNCTNGLGDPVIVYDRLADRWVLVEFVSGANYLCFYISQTPDPTGAYYNYEFLMPSFPDYPKVSIWPSAYFGTANEAAGTAVYAFDRANMLAGTAATFQRFTAPSLSGFGFQAMTSADLDGPTPPPTDAPGIFMRHVDSEAHGGAIGAADTLDIWEFDVDFTTPANTTFLQKTAVTLSEFDSDLCGLTSFSCITQPSGGSPLDPLREVIMNRLQYRNDVGQETIVGTFVTDVDATDRAGMRWFELRKSGNDWTLYQEGTYSPDSENRFMGAVAMDVSGNIALAYNVSSSTVFPSLRYTGRLASDTLGTMTQAETVIAAGAAANGSIRYGDYSAMGVDPSDDCTFWFTGQYNPSAQWTTRITSFKFPNCGNTDPDFEVASSLTSASSCVGSAMTIPVAINALNGFTGVVALTSDAPGTDTFTPATITTSGSSSLAITGAAAGTYTINITGTSGSIVNTTSVNAEVVSAITSSPTLTSPIATNSFNPLGTFSWNAVAGATGYTLEIATDASFANIVQANTATTNSYTLTNTLSQATAYYWRVRAINSCGNGNYSTAAEFTTSSEVCKTYSSADVPKSIPAFGDMQTSTISVSDLGTVIDVDVVDLDGTHTYIGDLTFSLTSPVGTQVDVISQLCLDNNDFDISLDDEASNSLSCPINDGSTEKPANPLSIIDNQSILGTWNLDINDGFGGDSGTLNGWGLKICYAPVVLPTSTATATATGTLTSTPTATNTPTATATSTATDTPTATSTSTATNTPTATATSTATNTPTATSTSTATNTPTATATPLIPTNPDKWLVYIPIITK